MDEMFAVVGIGLCLFAFLLVLLGLGSFYGGEWEIIAQGVTKFMVLVVGFAFGAYVLFKIMGRR